MHRWTFGSLGRGILKQITLTRDLLCQRQLAIRPARGSPSFITLLHKDDVTEENRTNIVNSTVTGHGRLLLLRILVHSKQVRKAFDELQNLRLRPTVLLTTTAAYRTEVRRLGPGHNDLILIRFQ